MKMMNLPTMWFVRALISVSVASVVNVEAAICERDEHCSNGGSCQFRSFFGDHGVGASCQCAPGYWGNKCQDVCELKCLNNGQCVAKEDTDGDGNTTSVECECEEGYWGVLCEKDASTTQEPTPAASGEPSQHPTTVPGTTPPTTAMISTERPTIPRTVQPTNMIIHTREPIATQKPTAETSGTQPAEDFETQSSLGETSETASATTTKTNSLKIAAVLVVSIVIVAALAVFVCHRILVRRRWFTSSNDEDVAVNQDQPQQPEMEYA